MTAHHRRGVVLGIDLHVLNFMRHENELAGDFGDFVMLGRQGLNVPPHEIDSMFDTQQGASFGRYSERLIETYFGADEATSIDNSDFEGAGLIMDLNVPVGDAPRTFDTILDAGTLEHVFHLPNALANVSTLVRPGGRIMHVLPANNQCGHGFWQFSPELFFSLYSEKNGYDGTEVYVAEVPRPKTWWRVTAPSGGDRVNLQNNRPMYVMCRTRRAREDFDHSNVQQSDYVHVWNTGRESVEESALRKRIRTSPVGPLASDAAARFRAFRAARAFSVSKNNTHLREVVVSDLFP